MAYCFWKTVAFGLKTGSIPCNRNIFSDVDCAIHNQAEGDDIFITGSENFVGPANISPVPVLQQPSTSRKPQCFTNERDPEQGKKL